MIFSCYMNLIDIGLENILISFSYSMLFLLTARVTSMPLLTSMFCTHMRHKDTFHDMDQHILHIHLAHRCSTITTKITATFDKLYIVFPPEFPGITSFWRDSKSLRVWSTCLVVVFSVSTHKGNPVNIHNDNGILNDLDIVEQ